MEGIYNIIKTLEPKVRDKDLRDLPTMMMFFEEIARGINNVCTYRDKVFILEFNKCYEKIVSSKTKEEKLPYMEEFLNLANFYVMSNG